MNKKAFYAADTAPFYAIFAIVVSVLFIFFTLILSHYTENTAEIPKNLEPYLLSQRFLRSPECFTYEDISGRSYSNVIDPTKFTQDRLNTCYNLEDQEAPAFKLTLNKETIQTKEIHYSVHTHPPIQKS